MSTRWIAVVGRKGGTGKTTLALGLAAHYLRLGLRVLLVDLDPQGSASLAMEQTPSGAELVDCLEGRQAAQPATAEEGLLLLSGGPELEGLLEPLPLREALKGEPLDIVLVDCPPGHAALDRLALDAADIVLAACEPHRLAIAGAARVLDEARTREPAPRCALVLGRVDERRGLDKAAPELLAGAFGLPVHAIHQDSGIAAALNSGKLPTKAGRAAEDLERVADWIDKGRA